MDFIACCFPPSRLRSWKAACSTPRANCLGALLSRLAIRCSIQPSYALLGVRFLLLCYWLGVWIWTLISVLAPEPAGWCGPTWECFKVWGTAYTHWSATLQLVYLFVAAAATVVAVCSNSGPESRDASEAPGTAVVTDSSPSQEPIPCIVRAMWLMQAVTFPLSLVVTVGYWAFAWPSSPDFPNEHPISILTHTTNSVVAWIDFLTGGLPVVLAHMWASMAITLLYGIQSLFAPAEYHFAGWKDRPELAATLTISGSLIVMPLIYISLMVLDRFIRKCSSGVSSSGTRVEPIKSSEITQRFGSFRIRKYSSRAHKKSSNTRESITRSESVVSATLPTAKVGACVMSPV